MTELCETFFVDSINGTALNASAIEDLCADARHETTCEAEGESPLRLLRLAGEDELIRPGAALNASTIEAAGAGGGVTVTSGLEIELRFFFWKAVEDPATADLDAFGASLDKYAGYRLGLLASKFGEDGLDLGEYSSLSEALLFLPASRLGVG